MKTKLIEEYFESFHLTHEAAYELLSEAGGVTEEIRLFDVRLTAAIGTDVSLNKYFRHANSEENREAYMLMLKLSNIWFSYESLVQACETEGLTNKPISKIDAFSKETLGKLDHDYGFFDVQLNFWGMGGRIKDNSKYNKDRQHYIDHLTNGATSKEQRRILADVYNRFTNNDLFSIKEALAFAYAVRNQYVHSGESPESGVKHISTKINVLRISLNFLTLFCLRMGELLMDSRRLLLSTQTGV